jgi:hypothetical protein
MSKTFILAILIVLASCNQYSTDITKINIIDGIRRSSKLPLSIVVDSILFIPLETQEECIVAIIEKILFSDNYIIIIIDNMSQVLLFDKTGKFINRFGNKEDGKSDFLSVHSSVVINKKLYIWDIRLNTTFCYNIQTGKCVRTQKHKFMPISMEYFNDSLLVYYRSNPPYLSSIFSRLHILSADFERSDSAWVDTKYSMPKRDIFDEGRTNIYVRNGNMYIWDSNIDTVFYFNNRFEKKFGYQFFLGRHALPEKDKYNNKYIDYMKDDECMITKVMETDRFFFVECLFGRRLSECP